MGSGVFDFALGEDIGNLRRPISVHAQLENLTNYLGGSFIHYPMVLIVRVFGVAVWRLGTQRFAGFALCLEHRTNFLTGVLGIKFVEQRLFGKGKDKQAEIQYSCGFAAGWLPKS